MGLTRLFGKLYAVLRVGSTDILLTFTSGEPDVDAFLRKDSFSTRFDNHPAEAALGPREMDALRTISLSILDRYGSQLESHPHSIRGRFFKDVFKDVTIPPGFRPKVLSKGPGWLELDLRSVHDARSAVCRVFPREPPGGPGILNWSTECNWSGLWTEKDLHALRATLLNTVIAVHVSFLESIQWTHSVDTSAQKHIDMGSSGPDFERSLKELDEYFDRLDLTITVPSMCLLRCTFCWVSILDEEYGQYSMTVIPPDKVIERTRTLSDLLRVHTDTGSAVHLVLQGMDILRFPRVTDFLQLLDMIDPESIVLLTPGTGLADPALVEELSLAAPRLTVIVTLLGHEESLHDSIAGRKGAFRELRTAVSNCQSQGIYVELNVVVVLKNQDDLAAVLETAACMGCKVNLNMYYSQPEIGPEQLPGIEPSLKAFRSFLDRSEELVRNQVKIIANAPMCILPTWAHVLAKWDSHILSDPPPFTPDKCKRCKSHGNPCHGPSRGHILVYGETELESR